MIAYLKIPIAWFELNAASDSASYLLRTQITLNINMEQQSTRLALNML